VSEISIADLHQAEFDKTRTATVFKKVGQKSEDLDQMVEFWANWVPAISIRFYRSSGRRRWDGWRP